MEGDERGGPSEGEEREELNRGKERDDFDEERDELSERGERELFDDREEGREGVQEEGEAEEEYGEPGEGLQSVTIEISGLSLYTHHGVGPAEREVGQRLLIDLRLEVGESDATVTDRLQDTVDYAEVCQLVALVAQQRSYSTLERLCSAIADRLLSDFKLESVWVKASKGEPPIPLPVEAASVEIWREAEG